MISRSSEGDNSLMLDAGQNLLHYRLVEKIGEGGMGVVWKAVDTTLDREVAIKVLPDHFAQDTERLARFEREAKLLASLNHPNIAAVFGLHESDTARFLAMELVAGEDLSQRLSRGSMTMESALRTAKSVAEALEAAHENGVIHRDLKPANIRQAPDDRVKVLDFGLAKAFDPVSGDSSDPSLSPTMTSAGTVAGMILGTASYMSPEQAAGQPTDKRCDVWAFGVVLYEMLTGRRMFEGETVSHTLADVLRADIDLDQLPAEVPRSIRRLLARCLDRSPKRRLRDIGEARVVIEDVLAGTDEDEPGESESPLAVTPPPAKRGLAWSVAAIASVIAVISLTLLLLPRREVPQSVSRFTVTSPNSGNLRQGDGQAIAISRDGRLIVTRGGSGNDDVLYLRAIDDFEPRVILGTSGARLPFFSPDGKWLAFVTSRGFFKVNLTGGAPISVGAFSAAPFGASWSTDGNIYFSSAGEIWKLPATGGEAESIAASEGDEQYRLSNPEALPSGHALLRPAAEHQQRAGPPGPSDGARSRDARAEGSERSRREPTISLDGPHALSAGRAGPGGRV
jgi:serine/threonine-protein kinase